MRFLSRKPRRSARARSYNQTRRPRFETLEDRVLLTAGFLDTTFGDGGAVISIFPGSGGDQPVRPSYKPANTRRWDHCSSETQNSAGHPIDLETFCGAVR